MKKAKKSVVIFEAPETLKQKADAFSEERMISLSAMCRQALDEWIDAEIYRKNERTMSYRAAPG